MKFLQIAIIVLLVISILFIFTIYSSYTISQTQSGPDEFEIKFKRRGKTPHYFKLDLDLEPMKRWQDMALEHKNYLIEAFLKYDQQFSTNGVLRLFTYKLIEFYANFFYQNQEMVQELQGIVNAVNNQAITLGGLFAFNLEYEHSTMLGCTGIVLQNQEGDILHGRNLDYYGEGTLARLSARVDIYKQGRLISKADVIVGIVGIYTGIKDNKFSINLNTRPQKSSTFSQILINVVYNKYISPPHLIRQVLIDGNSYEEALTRLTDTPLTTPVYYILGGTTENQGAVIERNTIGANQVYFIDKINWFLVQTNYDRNLPDPLDDYRRVPAENKLQEIGQSITINDLYNNVLTKQPTFNNLTFLTMTALVYDNYMNTTIWM